MGGLFLLLTMIQLNRIHTSCDANCSIETSVVYLYLNFSWFALLVIIKKLSSLEEVISYSYILCTNLAKLVYSGTVRKIRCVFAGVCRAFSL